MGALLALFVKKTHWDPLGNVRKIPGGTSVEACQANRVRRSAK